MNRIKITLVGSLVCFLAAVIFIRNREHKSIMATEQGAQKQGQEKSIPSAKIDMLASVVQAEETSSQSSKDIAILKKLHECYESEACDFPHSDPRSYEYAVGQALTKQLRIYRLKYRGLPGHSDELTQLARDYISSFDPHVQAEALELFADLPVSGANIEAIRTAIETTPDPLLMEKAMVEMERYLTTAYEAKVHETLSKVISSGAHFSAQTAAQRILPFLNSKSVEIYKDIVDLVPAGSKASQDLISAIREFERQESGA